MSKFDHDAFADDIDRLVTAGSGVRGIADWADEPMPLDDWLKAPEVFGRLDLSDLQYDTLRYAERVLMPATYEELGWPAIRQVSELSLAVGKGGGKGLVSRLIMARAIYQMLMLRNPLGYWGFPSTDLIHFVNVAVAAPQARHVIFTPMLLMFKGSRFFSERMEPRQTWIEFDGGLLAESGHSGQESQEGRSVLVGIIDEISGFKTRHELENKMRLSDREPAQSGEGIHRMLRSSIKSRFGDSGKLVSISYPRFKGCMIDNLVREAELEYVEMGEQSTKYSLRAATWDYNPFVEGKHVFDDDYRKDPQLARAMYEAKPSASPHRFFASMLQVRRVMGMSLKGDQDQEPPVITVGTEFYWGRDPMNDESVDGWQVKFDLSALEAHTHPMAIHADLALRHDAAGLAAAHADGWIEESETLLDEHGLEFTQTVRKPKIVVDFVIGLESIPADPVRGLEGSDIQMRWVRQLVRELLNREWRIGTFTADGYQSADLLQTFESWGIESGNFSLDRTTEGYDTLKNLIYDDAVRIPWHPVLFSELEALTKLKNGKLDHPAGLSKDLSDATGGAVHGAVQIAKSSAPFDPEDAWTGAGFEEAVKQRAIAEQANMAGAMMSPTSTDNDVFHEYLEHADQEMDRQRFEAAATGSHPERSSDEPF